MTNPLSKLLVDERKFDLELLASTLEDRVVIMQEAGTVRLTRSGLELAKKWQVLLYMLGIKAAHALEVSDSERVKSAAVAAATGMKPNSVSGQLTFLKTDGYLAFEAGVYWVPGHAVESACNAIEAADKN